MTSASSSRTRRRPGALRAQEARVGQALALVGQDRGAVTAGDVERAVGGHAVDDDDLGRPGRGRPSQALLEQALGVAHRDDDRDVEGCRHREGLLSVGRPSRGRPAGTAARTCAEITSEASSANRVAGTRRSVQEACSSPCARSALLLAEELVLGVRARWRTACPAAPWRSAAARRGSCPAAGRPSRTRRPARRSRAPARRARRRSPPPAGPRSRRACCGKASWRPTIMCSGDQRRKTRAARG